ncbi:hypothetical protein C7999DRAFT_44813 [Corynascus novoguineensis]|uniref:Uncharacterized protein n=1 Tax=Corynascus novoguineensis TaxID=1126955 RepID=A0AAN7HIF3_9PEZI|nr:hypothetical protein C7999DRAFT_44813 [Corynascus novoguineensis]
MSLDNAHHYPPLPHMEEQASLLLEQIGNTDRGPKGLRDLWMQAQQSAEGSLERILFEEGGFESWFAYICAKRGSEIRSHFVGKAACRNLVADLESRPADYLRQLATIVASRINPATKERVGKLRPMSQQPNKRRPNDSGETSATNVPSPTVTDHYPAAVAFPSDPAENEWVQVNASLEALRLFPPDFSDAIKRVPHPEDQNKLVAAISMTFPRTPYADRIGCQMTIEIVENQVEWIVAKLFNLRVETTEGLRYIRISGGGAYVLPSPDLVIRGCLSENISLFGSEVQHAIKTSPLSRDDIKRQAYRVNAVSIMLHHQASDGAKICLSLGLWEGGELKKQLYG